MCQERSGELFTGCRNVGKKAVVEMFAVPGYDYGIDTRREFTKCYFGAFSNFRNFPEIFLWERFIAAICVAVWILTLAGSS